MSFSWDIVEYGPRGAAKTVMLLPGGMCSAGSYAEVAIQPALANVRLVAVTLPGHAGAPPLADLSIESNARAFAELAQKEHVDVIVGFSMGASVAFEMIASGSFAGPGVLLGVSLSEQDEPGFFRAIVGLSSVLGTLPVAALAKIAGLMMQRLQLPPERRAELKADLARNDARWTRLALQSYLRWLRRGDDPAKRLCDAGVPAWVMHAEKGDGGLTAHERAVLAACSHVHLVTLPGNVFFLPSEAPDRVADVVAAAIAATRQPSPNHPITQSPNS